VDQERKLEQIEAALQAINEEEARTVRLFAAGKIIESVWDGLWREWQDRRQKSLDNLEACEHENEYHIDNLHSALHVISKIGVRCHQLDRRRQKHLLREVIEESWLTLRERF
jgi:hypothetical protein